VRQADGPGAAGGHPAGVICVRVALRPRETVDLPFAVAWYTPHLNTGEGGDYGHFYQTLWPNSYAAARALLTEWHSLLALTEEWQERILFSNLPRWLARRLINSVSPLATHSVYTRDGTFALLDEVGAPALRGPAPPADRDAAVPPASTPDFGLGPRPARPGSRLISLTHRLAISGLLTDFFPQLSARELRMFMARLAADGSLPSSLGDVDRIIGAPKAGSLAAVEETLVLSNGPAAPSRTEQAVEDTSSFLLETAQYVLRTGDREFLRATFPAVRRAISLLLDNRDSEGLPALDSGTLRPASASLFVAAMQAGRRLCQISVMQAFMDIQIGSGLRGAEAVLERASLQSEGRTLEARCEEARKTGSAAMEARYWTGRIYAERTPGRPDISALDQLAGIAFSDRLGGDGPAEPDQHALLPDAHVTAAIENIEALNDGMPATLLAPIARAPVCAGARESARFADPGAAILGLAALDFTRRRPEAGVQLLRRLDETRNNILLSPWMSPGRFSAETGAVPPQEGASIAQAADWNILEPIEGFSLDLSTGEIALSPQIPGTWRALSAPVFAPTFWARLEFRPTARGGVTSLRVDRLIALPAATTTGRLSGSAGLIVTRVRIPGPPPRAAGAAQGEPPVAHASRGTTPLGVKTLRDKTGDFILVFETPVRLTAGDRLEIDLH
jgi:hypothetical protein